MAISYALFENHLTSDPNDYAAQVRITGSADLDVIAQRMIDQGSTVTKPDILAVLEEAMKAIEGCLLDGYRVQLSGLCELFPRIKGVFNGITDTFDASRHRVDVGANPGARIRRRIREGATVTKTETIKPAPALLEYVDLGSGQTNGNITAGNIGLRKKPVGAVKKPFTVRSQFKREGWRQPRCRHVCCNIHASCADSKSNCRQCV